MPLCVIGSVALDSVETPTETRDDVLGGSAVYFSYAASFFTSVRLAGVVGDDWPSRHTDMLEARGIDATGLQVIQGGKTFRWRGKYMRDMNHRETLDLQLNVLGEFDPIIPEAYRHCKFLFLANGSPTHQLKTLDQCQSAKLVVADTMDHYIRSEREELTTLLKRIDGLVLNDSEAKLLTDDDNLVRAGDTIRRMGPKFVVIKKGEHGAIFFGEDEIYVLPRFPDARCCRSDRSGRQLRRRHDGLPGRARSTRPPKRSRRPWPTARSRPASRSKISASTGFRPSGAKTSNGG